MEPEQSSNDRSMGAHNDGLARGSIIQHVFEAADPRNETSKGLAGRVCGRKPGCSTGSAKGIWLEWRGIGRSNELKMFPVFPVCSTLAQWIP